MTGPLFALAAAFLFGLSSPIAKFLIGTIDPWLLAGILYLGSGIGMSIIHLVRTVVSQKFTPIKIPRSDLLWLAGVIFFGGVAGPVLLMYGLSYTLASTSSLLLNLEGVFTAGLAWLVFRTLRQKNCPWNDCDHFRRSCFELAIHLVFREFNGSTFGRSCLLQLECRQQLNS